MKEFQLEIIRQIQKLHSNFLNNIVEGITFLGEMTVVIAIIAFVYFIYDKKIGQRVVYISLFSMLVNNVIKLSVKASRPIGEPGIESIRVETAGGYSFPSGHSQNSATLLTWLALIIKKHWFKVLSIILILLIMFSRLYLGVHYPIDVIVGPLLGFGISMILFKKLGKVNKLHLRMAIYALVFVPFVIFFQVTDSEMANELFKLFGLFTGSICAFLFEEKYVNFQKNTIWWKATLRFVVGMILALAIQVGLKPLLPFGNYGDMIRYFLVAFLVLGAYPYVFKKLNF